MCVCKKCMTMGGATLLVLGALFLLQDFKIWSFWGISWYSALFVVLGIGHLGSASCKDCQAMREGKKK